MNMNLELGQRITFNPRQCGGHPCFNDRQVEIIVLTLDEAPGETPRA
jgi:uncharacterized protein (DUF433 family)